MLNIMRKHAGSWLIKVILGVIVVVFVFWGVGSYRSRQESRIAVVNGEVIALDEYRNAYQRLEDQYRSQFGDALNRDLLESLNLKEQALEQLINRRLLLQEADRLGLRVSDDELIRAIQGVSAFQENGRFSSRRYQRMLALNRMSPEMFEESMRQELLVEKMQDIILGNVKVSEAEVLERYKWQERQVRAAYVAFAPAAYESDLEISPEAVENYFSTHQNSYEIPPKVQVSYARFGFDDYKDDVEISQEEVEAYFERNREEYGTPKKVRARHILFGVDPDATEEQREAARNKAWVVMEQAKAGKDFAELAKTYSDDPGSKEKGGDLGFFTKDRMVEPFSEAAFAMEPGDVSEPVLTRFGWHVIKVEAVQEAKTPSLGEVEDQIREELVAEAAKRFAYNKAETFYDAAYQTNHIGDVSAPKDVDVQKTAFFARNESVEGVGQSREFAQVAFTLDEGEISEPVALSDGYYILEVIDRKAAQIPELSSVREEVKKDVTQIKADEAAREKAEAFLASIKEGTAFEDAAERFDVDIKDTGFFKRSDPIPDVGRERRLVEQAFSLKPSAPIADSVIQGGSAFYVIRLKERQDADMADFEAQKKQIETRLISGKRQKRMEEWFAQLRQQGEVSIKKGFLD